MKKNIKLLTLTLSSLLIVGLVSCGSKNEAPTENNIINLNVSEKKMILGDKLQIIALYEKAGDEVVTWSSDNERVATVFDGEVKAIGLGNATITATYLGFSSTCYITVTLDDSVPSLVISNVSNDELTLAKGNKFNVDGKVLYNNNYYDCALNVETSNESVVSYNSNGQLVAKDTGTATINISTSWMGFESSLLSKSFTVNVTNDTSLYTNITLGNKTEISNELELSIVNSFEGKSYFNSALIEPFCYVDGIRKEVQISLSDDSIVTFDEVTRVIKAKNVGTTYLTISYIDTNSNINISSNVKITVYSPLEVFDKEVVEFCSNENFPVSKYFGNNASILSATQNGKELTVKRSKLIQGIKSNGYDTEPIQVTTDKGSYLFTKLYVYDVALTKENIYENLVLASGKVIDQYFVLNEDIIGADMTKQADSSYSQGSSTNTYFVGTLDGRGHTLDVKVARSGLFGGFSEGASIKNAHLHFDFAAPKEGQYSIGLARNVATYIRPFAVSLENLYITASNYVEGCYPIYDFKLNNTSMSNIYVDLTGSGIENLPKFENTQKETGCLFRLDGVLMNGPSSCFLGNIRNTYVVTGTESFMPLACGKTDGANVYVTYAKNDTTDMHGPNYLGTFKRNQTASSVSGYCIGIYDPDAEANNEQYFGNIPTNLNGGARVCWIYEGQNGKTEWGIFRFNSNADFKQYLGVNKVGDWKVND